jgi:hypothetical protein
MLHQRPSLLAALALALGLAAPAAHAGRLADVEVIDRKTGEVLEPIHARGRLWVAGTPGRAYSLRVRNQTGGRLLAVMSVDGVNVLSGQTASAQQGGYVFSPWEQDEVRGWRKSLRDVAQFRFTALGDSYAARTGRPNHVGVIGLALYREAWQEPPRYWPHGETNADDGYRYPPPVASRPEGESDAYGNHRKRPHHSAGDAAAESASPQSSAPKPSRSAPLGTGHGRRERDEVGTTEFVRASSTPEEVIEIYYDSKANLIAAGILPPERRYYGYRRPQAFPGGFVPDP